MRVQGVHLHRIYINFLDAECIWSVDEGDVSTEKHFKTVCIDGISYAASNLTADNKKEPKAWIAIEDSALYSSKDGQHAYVCQYLERGFCKN